ncbi:hypothetical protein CC117_12020 [Parafrankia colletiae]|uniref:DUF8175 domain-containing protein n=1 Tax=Parafrankia colletiae TaxID=573497 RepID=A0A1S1R960_9ACTN|nr:hypothetical protein [Parafrankia colletiae]MCK9900752.1 hypothetical protein [Frankia sp. Cpl3]OHV42301.1 hypothetical protein CC117_12020 [Parafrankia colletiae]
MRTRPDRALAARLTLAAALVVGLASGCGPGDAPAAAPPGPAPSTTAPTSVTPTPTSTTPRSQEEALAGRPTTPAGAATTAPADIGFVDTELYELPGGERIARSPSAGPSRLDNNLATGFARTPLGAVVAGINIAGRADGSLGEPIYRPTIERQVIGDGQADLLRRVHRDGRPDVPATGEQTDGTGVGSHGFTLHSYTDDEATISYLLVATRGSQHKYAVYRLTVRWVDGDWKLLAPPNGDFGAVISTPTSIDGFQPFERRGIPA